MSIIALAVSAALGTAEFTPTEQYETRGMRGWVVRVNPDLLAAPDGLADRTLELLDDHLYRITRAVPEPALGHIRQVPIWVELDMHKTACMCYHVSAGWLAPNGYNPEKEGSIEVGNAEAFLSWTHAQPWMVLHELAHGYHHLVLGVDHPEIAAAWQRTVDSGEYDSVLHINGSQRRHYALTNREEWFAEATEAYFGTNDFFPFVRAELQHQDPEAFALIRRVWNEPPAEPVAGRPRRGGPRPAAAPPEEAAGPFDLGALLDRIVADAEAALRMQRAPRAADRAADRIDPPA